MNSAEVDADVVIVGAGIAGALVAYKLAKAGIKVIVLEGGPEVTRSELHAKYLEKTTWTPTDLDPLVDYAPTTIPDHPNHYFINTGPVPYNISMTKAVGGTTWHWGGYCARFLDNDFRIRSAYGVGIDWPIGYQDLEPFYTEAEHEMGVSAPSQGWMAERRSKPVPMPDFAWPHVFRRLRDILAPHGLALEAEAHARNTREYDGRPACRGNNTCWPLCPIGAQYNGIVHVDKARELGVEVRAKSLAIRLETGKDRLVEAVVFRRPDGTLGRVRGRITLVAANGVETPKLLLASRSEAAPEGLANTSDQVGRNLMDHPTFNTFATAREVLGLGRGPISFARIRKFNDGPFRKDRAATTLWFENKVNVPGLARDLLHNGLNGDDLERELRSRVLHDFGIHSDVEMLPEPENRITLDWDKLDTAGQPRMRINLSHSDYTKRTFDFLEQYHAKMAGWIGATQIRSVRAAYHGHHPAGAARMGNNPGTSVVDDDCRSHDHPNLFLASSAVFPTSGGPESTTLTIAALALRTAEAVKKQLGER